MANSNSECLSDKQKHFHDLVLKGDLQEITTFLSSHDIFLDCLDKNGMTPLQHAAMKGRADVVRFLLDNGADVNSDHHENSYTTLHFGALSGNVSVVNLLLEAGVKTDRLNSVNRTAAQMAAFVGQHECVRAINNFFPRRELEKYTVPRGLEHEPKLPPHLLPPLLQLVNSVNLHPVKIAMMLRDSELLVLESCKVCRVLDSLVEVSMKACDTNDTRALKCHYLATIIRLAKKSLAEPNGSLDRFVRSLVKGREKDGFHDTQDRLVRQALKEFPYLESQLLQTLVRQIAPVKIGEGTSAVTTLMSGMYGPSFNDDIFCTTCGTNAAGRNCAVCKCTKYCNQACQKLDWPSHKKFCQKLAVEFRRMECLRRSEEETAKSDNKNVAMMENDTHAIATKMDDVRLADGDNE